MSGVTPIFLLGCGRSGTTTLANLLGSHPAIASVQHPLHHGDIEFKPCYHRKFWGDIRSGDAYIRFVHAICCDDFVRLSGATPEWLLQHRSHDFYEFFFSMMDRLATEQSSPYWLNKLDGLFYSDHRQRTEFMERVDERYEDARFISIVRPLAPYLQSYLRMEGVHHANRSQGIGRFAAAVLGAARYTSFNQQIEQIMQARNGLPLEFQEVTENLPQTKAKLASFLDIDNEFFTEPPFVPNSSFAGGKSTATARPVDTLPWIATAAAKSVNVSHGIVKIAEQFRRFRNPIYTRTLEYEYCPDELKKSLESEGAFGLIQQEFEQSNNKAT